MNEVRAVAYIRVSTSSDEQLHSYIYQEEYYKQLLDNRIGIKLIKIYSDKGISGRSLYKRPQLNKLLEDANKGLFDEVYTKSVSRFARNTEDLLNTVRYLRELHIKVIFEKENIDTFDPSSELYLTIAGAVAENDLKIYAENQRWAIREKFKNGMVVIGNKIFGYRMNKDTNTLIVNEEEAKVIRRIFELYLSGLGISPIVKTLEKEKCINIHGNTKWSEGTVRYILRNEKYKGCSLNQKTVKINGVEKNNNSLAKKYYMEEVHEAIISKEMFDEVQKIYDSKGSNKLKGRTQQEKYPFTGLIECECCKGRFTHKFNNPNKKWRCAIWSCHDQNKYGKSYCSSTNIKDEVLRNMFIESFNEFIQNPNSNTQVATFKEERQKLLDSENELNILRMDRLITNNDYDKELDVIKLNLKDINIKISNLELEVNKEIKLTEFDEEKVSKYIEKITIGKGTIKFIFKNGIEILKEYTNGSPGNKKGWNKK